jgi:Methyltransferase domain
VCIWTEFSAEGAAPDTTAVISPPACSTNISGMLALPNARPGYYMFNAAVVIIAKGVIDSKSMVSRLSRFLVIGPGTQNSSPPQSLNFKAVTGADHDASCSDLYLDAQNRWQRRSNKRKAYVNTLDLNGPASKTTWDPFEFEWDCSIRERVGIHLFGDGSKFMCGAEYLALKNDCLVYSIGSAYDDGFEQALLQIAPNCEV